MSDHIPTPGDVHINKASHMSVPLGGDQEFHVNKKDLKESCEEGKKYVLEFQVICTSVEGDSERFKPLGDGIPIVEPYEEHMKLQDEYRQEEESGKSFSDMPREELKKRLPKAGY